MASSWERITDWYWKYERHLSSLGLISGFLFDIFTLTRVDQFWENVWVGFHLVVAAAGILFLNLYEEGRLKAKVPGRAHFWWTFVIQFAFGGLFSVYLVFYSRSASFFASWPFLLVLALNFIANERLRERYSRTGFQVSMLFLGIFFYSIYIIPIVVGRISTEVFILSGAVSLGVMVLFFFILALAAPHRMKGEKWVLFPSIAGVYLLINILYFTNTIPPIPLSLKQADVYHSVSKDAGLSSYTVLQEVPDNVPWYQTYFRDPTIHLVSGDEAYVFTAIFAPARFSTSIVHRWQYYDPTQKKWITEGIVPLSVSGGRDNGFRTYSARSGLSAGRWRVSVETGSGQVIGRLGFRVEPASYEPLLQEVKR